MIFRTRDWPDQSRNPARMRVCGPDIGLSYIISTSVIKQELCCIIAAQQWRLVWGRSTCQNLVLAQSFLFISTRIHSPVLTFLIRSDLAATGWQRFWLIQFYHPRFDYRLGSWLQKMWDLISVILSFMMIRVMRWLTKLTWEEAVKFVCLFRIYIDESTSTLLQEELFHPHFEVQSKHIYHCWVLHQTGT